MIIYNSQAALDEQKETTNNWKLRVTLNCRPVVALHYWFQIFGSIVDPETSQVTDLGQIGGGFVNNYPQIWDPATGTYKADWSGLGFIVSATVSKTYQNTILKLSLSTYNDSCYCTLDEPDITYCYLPSIRDNSCPVNYGNPTNVTTSNKTYQKTDLSIDTPSGKLEFYRTYNSLLGSMGDNRYVPGPLGYNWTHNFNYGLTISGSSPSRKIAFRKPDGKIVVFAESSGVFSQTTPGEQFKLTDNGNNTFTLKQEDGSRIQFNSTIDDNTQFIRPEWLEDSKGRRLTITYAHYQEGTNAWIELPLTLTDQWGNGLGFDHEIINGKYTGRIQAVYNLKTPSEKVLFTYSTPNGNDYSGIDNLIQATYPNSTQILYYFENPNYKHSLTRIVDENNNTTYYEYDAYNRFLSFHQEGSQGYYSFAYDWKTPSQGQWKTTVTDSLNRQSVYQIIDSGNERTITVAGPTCGGGCGSIKNYIYDKTNGNLLETEDGNNIITQYTNYDSWGNAQTVTEAVGTSEQRVTTSTYDPNLNVLLSTTVPSVLGGGNEQTIYDYDDDGNATPNENPTPFLHRLIEKGYTRDLNGAIVEKEYITTYAYNTNSQIATINGPRTDVTDVTTYTYYADDPGQGNNRARLYQVTLPESQTTTYADYDAYGRVGSITDPNGLITLYAYDFKGRVSTITLVAAGPTGEDLVTNNFYEANGNLDYIKLPGGRVIDYGYDSTGRLTSITRRIGPDDQTQAIDSIKYTYDTEGNKTNEQLREGEPTGTIKKTTSYNYDAYNWLWKLIHANATYQEYGYDAAGNRTSAIDEKTKETDSLFDALNRLKTVTQPGSITTGYNYDPHDNLTQVTDANGKITTYEYDDFGRMLKNTSPDAGIIEYRYDEAGNMIKKINALGIITNFTCDALNRMLTLDLPGTDEDVSYTYDTGTNGIGRLTGITDPSGTLAYQYDKQGNLTQEQKTMDSLTFITQYQYDKNGNPKKITYPNGREVTYTLNQANQITQVDSTMGGNTKTLAQTITYAPFGPIQTYIAGNGLPINNSYDTDYQLTSLQAGAVINRNYQYDETGNVTQISNMGNLPVTTAEALTYAYQNNNNQLTQAINGSSTTFAYNPAGNLITEVKNGTTRTYTYNYSQRLTSVTEGSTTLGEYTYDALGRITNGK
jgi:YD repeat-containing protein